jgi:hypothetical protein
MTREEAINHLRAHHLPDDVYPDADSIEVAHIQADEILCDFLLALGYQDVVQAYRKVPKWA